MKNKNYHIRLAKREDAPTCHDLIMELAIFEKAPEKVSNTLAQFTEDGFGKKPIYHLYVAEWNATKEVVGMALFVIGYSTWKGKMLYLDDLVVREAYRGNGIGRALIDKLFEYAQENEVKIVKWQVLDWNEPAIKFYKKLNMTLDAEWIDCKMQEKGILEWVTSDE